jgi:hypothetical protein
MDRAASDVCFYSVPGTCPTGYALLVLTSDKIRTCKRHPDESPDALISLVRLEGFEPPTYGLEVRCSIQLSYRRGICTSYTTFDAASQAGHDLLVSDPV